MANVLFKRGLQHDLPSTTANVVDGAFYLTTDTNRLYVGQADRTLKLLNQTVQIVASISELPTFSSDTEKSAHVNDFYYCTAENVLCVWKSNVVVNGQNSPYGWQQINKNTDTYNLSNEFTTSANSNSGTVSYSITDSEGGSITASFAIDVNGGLSLSATGTNGLVITGKEYSLSRAVANDIATISLENTADNTTSDIVLRPGDNISFSSTGTAGIVINAVDSVISNADLAVSTGTLAFSVVDDGGNAATATLANVGVIVGNSGNSYLPINSTSGKTAATVYTKDEVDTLIQGLNGITYKGTLANNVTATVSTLPSTNVQNGDMYLVIQDGLTAQTVGGTLTDTAISMLADGGTRVGDMFVAVGTETNGVLTNPQWTYIPSGNDELRDVTYHSVIDNATSTIELQNGYNEIFAGLSFVPGTDVTISTTSANSMMTNVISHASITTTAVTATVANASTITAISGININNGHITGYETTEYTPVSYEFTNDRATTAIFSDVLNGTRRATATNAGLNDLTVATTLQTNDQSLINSSLIKFSSESIALSKGSDGEVVMNMEWGTF